MTTGSVPWVIVLNYRRPDLTGLCVESLRRTAGSEAWVVVVDNGSPDEGALLREALPPDTVVVPTEENLGYAGGMNVGIRMALAAEGSHTGPSSITVLNNDTTMSDGGIEALDRLAIDSEGLVSPLIFRQHASDVLWFGGGVIDSDTNFPRHLTETEVASLPQDRNGVANVQVLSGCCLTATPTVWRRIGLFDERFFLNFEDSELSVRATDSSVPLLVFGGVRLEHAVSASFSGPHDMIGAYYYTRNGLVFATRVMPGGLLVGLRFLRRHVYPNVRPGGWLTVGRTLAALCGVGDYLRGRNGKAPRVLEVAAHGLWRMKERHWR